MEKRGAASHVEIVGRIIVQVPPQGGRKHPEQKMVAIDTRNILFVCGGAFDGIERVIGKRLSTQAIGYASTNKEKVDKENLLQYIAPQDLKGFGLIRIDWSFARAYIFKPIR